MKLKINEQYNLKKILILWSLSAIPMGVLAYVVTPQLINFTKFPPVICYWISVIVGLFWQFILSLIALRIDGYEISRSTVITRMKYQKPINPQTGKSSYLILFWSIPFIILSAIIQSGIITLPDVDGILSPLLKYIQIYDLSSLSTSDYEGEWWILILLILTFVFNYFLGEEFFYRGILLPKMNGVFGKWDWFANGILFGFYHLHKPQVILSTALYFGFVFAFPSKLFNSNWMAVIIHGLEGLMGIIIILAIILGYT